MLLHQYDSEPYKFIYLFLLFLNNFVTKLSSVPNFKLTNMDINIEEEFRNHFFFFSFKYVKNAEEWNFIN